MAQALGKWADWQAFHAAELDVRMPDKTLPFRTYFNSKFFNDGSYVEIRNREGKPYHLLMPPMHYKLKQTEPWWSEIREKTLEFYRERSPPLSRRRGEKEKSPHPPYLPHWSPGSTPSPNQPDSPSEFLFLADPDKSNIITVESDDSRADGSSKCGCNDLHCIHCDHEDSEIDQLDDSDIEFDQSDDSSDDPDTGNTSGGFITKPIWAAEKAEVANIPVTAEEVIGSVPHSRKRKSPHQEEHTDSDASHPTSSDTNTTPCRMQIKSQNWFIMRNRLMQSFRRYTDKEMQFLADNFSEIDINQQNSELRNEILLYLQTKNINTERQVCKLNSQFYVIDGYPTSSLEYNRRRRWRCLMDTPHQTPNNRIGPYMNTRCREVKEHCSCNLHAPVDLVFLYNANRKIDGFCHFCFSFYDKHSAHFTDSCCPFSRPERPLTSETDKLKMRGHHIRKSIASFIESKNQRVIADLMLRLEKELSPELFSVLAGLSRFRSSKEPPGCVPAPNTVTNFDAYLTSINYVIVRSEAHVIGQFFEHFNNEVQGTSHRSNTDPSWSPLRLDPEQLPQASQCINLVKDINFGSLRELFGNVGLNEQFDRVYNLYKNQSLKGAPFQQLFSGFFAKLCRPNQSTEINWNPVLARKAIRFYKSLLNSVLHCISQMEHRHTIHIRNCVINPADPIFVLPSNRLRQAQRCGCDSASQPLTREKLQQYNRLACFYTMLSRQITKK